MPALEERYLRDELRDRRARLETAIAASGADPGVARLLQEVDAALARMEAGTYGLCDVCHDTVEIGRLLGDPLIRTCLDHLTPDEQRRLEQDLDLAARVQSGLLPKQDVSVSGWEVSYHYEPAGPVSGDYCDLITPEKDGGDLFVLLGDVSGKGVAASMLMAGLRATVRTLMDTGLRPADLMARANRLFCESALPQHYATLVLGKAARSGAIEICNAGHSPPLLVRGGRVTPVGASGLPIGLFCSGQYSVTTTRLDPGDSLVLYTDGLSEARDPSGTEYGTERLSRLLAERHALRPKGIVSACLKDVASFSSNAPRSDDLTLMAIRRVGGA
jgi:sigma-B regulation protein RsbU (phosphoserine phosphatase)